MNKTMFPIRFFKLVKTHNIRGLCTKIEEPIKFSTSPAARRNTITPVMNPNYHLTPWYQPFVVSASVAIFLIYFCILREENDLDLEFSKTLYERVQGMEKTQLVLSYKYNKEHGISTEDIEKRLKEIEEVDKK